MPRSGWLAAGAVLGALATEQIAADGLRALTVFGAAGCLATWAVLRLSLHRVPGRGWIRQVPNVTWLVSIGLVIVIGRTLVATSAGTPGPITLPTGNGPWSATVESVSAPRAGQHQALVLFDQPSELRVAVGMPIYPVVVPGDLVMLTGPLRAASTGDSYGAYLARIGARATMNAARVTVAPPNGTLGRWLEGLRRGADRALQLAVPEPEAGLASGIIVGLRDRVDRALTADFTAVGATHVVAISGWNIAIVATSLAAVAGRLARRRRVLLTLMAIVAYVAFVGPSPSVVRAAGMAGVVMLARELGRPSRAAAAIGWAVCALLVVDPHLVEDVGFQLSALATVGLIAWGTPFAERLAGPAPRRPRAWLAESLGVSLAAQLATLPIIVLSFGRLSLVSPVVNLAVVPLVAPAMGAGVVALVGGLLVLLGLPGLVATLAGLPAWLLFSVMVGSVRLGASVPFASVELDPVWAFGVAAASVALMIMVTRLIPGRGERSARAEPGSVGKARPGSTSVGGRGGDVAVAREPTGSSRDARLQGGAPIRSARWHRQPSWWLGRAGRFLAAGLIGSIVALAVVVVQRPDGVPRVTVLDVGQGDAILVEGGRGGRLLVDGGPDPGRLLVALDEHLPPWDRRIDLVILSHPHEDHAAGLAALLDRYAVSRVYEPGMFGPGPGYAALNAELVTLGIPRGTLTTGDRLTVDEFRFRVLWPDPGAVPEVPPDNGTGINNVSVVLLGEVNGHRLLLAGDVEEQIDPRLLARGLPSVDLLKVAHHGSRTASTEPFLDTVHPAVAVISAGRGNPYGHPSPATIARLEGVGARVLRTDTNGTVSVELGPGPLRVRRDVADGGSGPDTAQATLGVSGNPGRGSVAPGSGSVARSPAFLCAIPLPPLGIVALASSAPPAPLAARTPSTSGAASSSWSRTPSASGAATSSSRLSPKRVTSTAVGARPLAETVPPPLAGTRVAGVTDLGHRLGYDALHDSRSPSRPTPPPRILAKQSRETRRRRAWLARR